MAHPRRLVVRDGPGRRLSSDNPWCPRTTGAFHDEWRKMPRGRVEIPDLHVRFAASRCRLAKSATGRELHLAPSASRRSGDRNVMARQQCQQDQ
jgi:hypothetical protein